MKLAAFSDVSDAARLALHVVVAPWLPWRAERRLVAALAARGAPLADGVHARVAHHLAACLPGAPTANIATLARANVAHRWTDRELVWLWRTAWSARRRRALTRDVRLAGLEHLQASVARGRGTILLETHLGKRVLARETVRQAGFAVRQVHAASHGGAPTLLGRHVLRPLHRLLTRRAGVEVVEIAPGSLAYLRTLTASLGANAIVAIPGIGDVGEKVVAVDALGTTLAVPTGTLSLARASGATVLPILAFEDAGGRDHVVIEPPLPTPVAGDAGLAATAAAYGAVLDTWVRRHPAQWFWWFAPPTPAALPASARRLAADHDVRR